ncbi:hypothetical protein KPY62_10200 [Psychrobacter sp. TAE2020]|uniref:hypothetical protein n=1 Tax=Psychrobacter TaxID=497 RepID=UPI0019197451|nr:MULTISPECIES: hypothetical protein [Psychrobacter]MBU5617455.1 hypothetical protein [Psychrobacter sp. TAE2020]
MRQTSIEIGTKFTIIGKACRHRKMPNIKRRLAYINLLLITTVVACMYNVCPFDGYPPLVIRLLADTKGQASNYNKKKPAMQGITSFFCKTLDLELS